MFKKLWQAVKRVINRWFKKEKVVDAVEADIILQLQQSDEEYSVWDFSAYEKYGVVKETAYGDLKNYNIDDLEVPYVFHGVVYVWNDGGYTVDTGTLYFLGRLKQDENSKWVIEEEEEDKYYYNDDDDYYAF